MVRKQATPSPRVWRAALYTRLSRDDGDKAESNSIIAQRTLLEDFVAHSPDLVCAKVYSDDGCSGTNFDRPGFQEMIQDIENGTVDCILVKDLSRFGRDYLDTGYYLERWLPQHGVRFLALNDHIDSAQGKYDLMLPFKNVFNEQYARDISQKVRSAFRTKQAKGQFVGAFASYGYQKSPQNHNHLEIDPVAAPIVQRIFDLFESGLGKIRIAKLLNAEKIPCPSEYKRLCGEHYTNNHRNKQTTYWTYSTIHRMLQNPMYIGAMTQGKAPRAGMHGKATLLEKSQWAIVPGTHEAIISMAQWERVQALLQKNTRHLDFMQNLSPFAGFLTCGDCGRALCKTRSNGRIRFGCGSYKRYGPTVCSPHNITQDELSTIVLEDLNRIIASIQDLQAVAKETAAPKTQTIHSAQDRLQTSLDRLTRLKKSTYEDYREGLLSKEDFLLYQADYNDQIQKLTAQMEQLHEADPPSLLERPWVRSLLQHGKLTELDRTTIAETIQKIQVYADGHLEITYRFADDLGLFPDSLPPKP